MPMRQIRTILTHRLTHNLSLEQTALAVRRSKGSVFNICNRFTSSGLVWPLDPELTDDQLETALFPPSVHPKETSSDATPPLPDIGYIEQQLARKNVTIALLYEEYRREHPDGISQASFYRYVRSQKKPNLSLHHVYKGGDILYSDYSGDGLEYIDIETGECIPVELFVATLAASSRIYAEGTLSQHAHHFTMAHVHAFEFYGGVSACIVPDNLKSAVTKANRYDPTINHLFAKFAEHYGTTILPARVRAPRDKGSVESAVLIAQRRIIAALRDQKFFSLAEINSAIAEQVDIINTRPMKDHGGRTRNERFADCDKPYLKPLTQKRFTISEIRHDVAVGLDYHIQFRKHFYSVPYALAKKKVDVHLDGLTVEIYHNGIHCCRHQLSLKPYRYTTKNDHMPPNHAFVRGMKPQWFIDKARQIGTSTTAVAEVMMKRCTHPQQGFRAAQGLLSLAKAYEPVRVENACAKALHFKSTKLADIKSILKNGLDAQQVLHFPTTPTVDHENIRGGDYYQQ
jgi:transposase